MDKEKDTNKEKGKDKEKSDGRHNGQGALSGEAALRLVNFMFDPDEEHLPMITKIERRAVLPLSLQIMRETITSQERVRQHIPLTRIWRIAYMKLQRSVDMKGFLLGVGLAHKQVEEETEKAEEVEW